MGEKRRDAKAKFGNARDKKWKLRPKVKFEKKIRAGLIEQEDGDERPTKKGTDSRVKAATRTKDKIKEKRRDAKAKFGNARDKKWKLRPKVKFEKKIRAGL